MPCSSGSSWFDTTRLNMVRREDGQVLDPEWREAAGRLAAAFGPAYERLMRFVAERTVA